MSGHQIAVGHHMTGPVVAFFIDTAVGLEHVFHQEGNDVGELHALFFTIGEPGDVAAFDQRFAVVEGVTKRSPAHGKRPRSVCRYC